MGPTFTPGGESIGVATVAIDGVSLIGTSDGAFHPVPRGYVRNVIAVVLVTSGPYDGDTAYLVSAGDGASGLLLAAHATYVEAEPPPGDGLAGRRAQWDADALALIGPRPE